MKKELIRKTEMIFFSIFFIFNTSDCRFLHLHAPPSTLSFPDPLLLLFSFRKEQTSQGNQLNMTEQTLISRLSKAAQQEEEGPRSSQKSQRYIFPCHLSGVLHKHKVNNHNVYVDDLVQPYAGEMVHHLRAFPQDSVSIPSTHTGQVAGNLTLSSGDYRHLH